MELAKRIAESIELLQKGEGLALALDPIGGYYVGFSGGKDSVVLLSLVKLSGVRYRAQYNVVGNDAPETIKFIREHYPEVEFAHPKEKFIQLVRKKGMPTMGTRFCCERTKEHFGAGCVVLTGVRAEESRKRASYAAVMIQSRRKEHKGTDLRRDEEWLSEVQHECIRGKDRVKVYPLLNWTEEEVWEYINHYKLPVNPLYAKFGRVGCMFCPFASRKQIEAYEEAYPGFHRAILQALRVYWKRTDDHMLSCPEEYYDWWKSKQTVERYKAIHDIALQP